MPARQKETSSELEYQACLSRYDANDTGGQLRDLQSTPRILQTQLGAWLPPSSHFPFRIVGVTDSPWVLRRLWVFSLVPRCHKTC